ncbi:MAG: GHKL domain-containing protein [bacterium]|nr:GHKL domain-containing protein [bacterium]
MSDKEELEKLKKTFEDFINTSSQLQGSYETLKEESQRLSLYLSNILENMKSAILVFDNNCDLTLWNGLCREYFPSLAQQRPPVKLAQLSADNRYGIELETILSGERQPVESAAEIDGENKWLEIDSSDFIDYKNQKIGYLLVINDKTELKKLQIKSQQEDRLRVMGELAAEVAHEIRNPLGSIELMVTLLQEDLQKDPRPSELLTRIRTSVDNMNHIVTNILLYTKDLQLDTSQFTVADLVNASESIAINTIVKKSIGVTKELPDLLISADFELLKQSLANIFINAAQAAPQQGSLSISAEVQKNSLVLHIRDNGPGIPAEIRDKIFKPFFTTKNTGTGLGLAMVKRVIEAHSGDISFQSDGKGTLFIVQIPLK